ncbi:carbonic anhydrase [Methylolobus aquaticus]|uniref:carbonic anhydrase n=1 Tax=Methylotetracoccus oryzae TaxID=1919059 RepID=UPI00111B8F15|nr:carbonic anhydrase [Methylotetracoccus oryzae]
MKAIERLLLENKAWAEEHLSADPEFLNKLGIERECEIFWIGCSDSRVHADEITNSEPGSIFVHRNIANSVMTTDINLLSALEYAVDELRIRHVIVCGHYECGGVRAALRKTRPGQFLLNKWLKQIKDVYRLHRAELDALATEHERQRRLVELNVIEQIHNLAQTSTIQRAWTTRKAPELHGWVYGLDDGIIREIAHMDADTPLDPLYEFELGPLA